MINVKNSCAALLLFIYLFVLFVSLLHILHALTIIITINYA